MLVLVLGSGDMARAVMRSSTLDVLPEEAAGPATESIEVGRVRPAERRGGLEPGAGAAGGRPTTGNPLWAIPLSVLTATRERPVFSASRRPPPKAVVAPPPLVAAAPPPPPPPPQPPSLTLIGAVVGDDEAIAVFLDTSNQGVVRLRRGENHAGWVLDSVAPREVSLKQGDRIETLALQRQGAPGIPGLPVSGSGVSPVPGVGPTPTRPPQVTSTAPYVPGVTVQPPPVPPGSNASFAPFVPRSTPKNGEPDGL